MPFESEAQRRWMWVNDPEMARRWADHTPEGAKLPERVAPKRRTKIKAEAEVEPAVKAASGRTWLSTLAEQVAGLVRRRLD